MGLKLDLYVDISYGLLLLLGIGALMLGTNSVAAATFGVGVLLGYVVHVFWRMKRFAAEMENTVEDTVEEAVEKTLDEVDDAPDDVTVEANADIDSRNL